MEKPIYRILLRSPLQEKLLNQICKTKGADYHTLSRATDRDRITIMQSLEPLLNQHYIKKEKENLDKRISKLRFSPTPKGIGYAVTFLGADLEKIKTTRLDPDALHKNLELMKDVIDVGGRRRNELGVYQFCTRHNLFNEEDGSFPAGKEPMNTLFKIMLLQFVYSKGFDIDNLFRPKDIEYFKKITIRSEREELINLFKKVRSNLDASLKKLSS